MANFECPADGKECTHKCTICGGEAPQARDKNTRLVTTTYEEPWAFHTCSRECARLAYAAKRSVRAVRRYVQRLPC